MKLGHVLTHATKEHVSTDPFPHLVIENAVSDDVLTELIHALPTHEAMAKGKPLGSNKHFPRHWDDEVIPSIWKEFMQLHLTQEFFDTVVSLVGEHMERVHPQLVAEKGSLSRFRTGLRRQDTYDTNDILLDGQLFVTTPVVSKPNSYRIGHVDDPTKLYNGLLYLRLPDDDTTTSNLELCRYKSDKKKFHNPLRKLIDHKYIETVKTIPYRAGTFVLIPNSLQSVHRVQARERTKHPCYYMNVLGELDTTLFDLTPYWEGPIDTLRRKVGV